MKHAFVVSIRLWRSISKGQRRALNYSPKQRYLPVYPSVFRYATKPTALTPYSTYSRAMIDPKKKSRASLPCD